MDEVDVFNFINARYAKKDDREPGGGTFSKDVVLQNLYPHYTNDYYKHPRSVFGKETKGIGYDYSDRLVEWDYGKHQKAWEHASNTQTKETCLFFEAYLSFYFDRPVEILHILAGFNWGNGYPYQVFGYRFTDNP